MGNLRAFSAMVLAFSCLLPSPVVLAVDGVSSTTILIGQTVGLTGTVAAPVKEMNEGANAYFAQVNRSGGIHGRQIVLRTLDDKFDPARTLENTTRLIKEDHVFALFQGRGTPHTKGILPLLAVTGVPLVGPTTGADLLHHPINPLVFNVRPRYQDEVATGVKHFATLGLQRIALLHVDDAFGLDARQGFTEAMGRSGLAPDMIRKFERVNPDYAGVAADIVRADPDALILASSSKNTVEMIKALRSAGSLVPILTLSVNSSTAFVNELGADGTGVIVVQVMPVPDLKLSLLAGEFIKAAQANKATLSYAAMEGFVNAKVLVEGLKRAGPTLTREKFIKALESIQKFDLGGLQIDYSASDHSGSAFLELTMIGKDGKFIR
jgi:ABC-type branched-subunit amino acid transport system substrate-binding protein